MLRLFKLLKEIPEFVLAQRKIFHIGIPVNRVPRVILEIFRQPSFSGIRLAQSPGGLRSLGDQLKDKLGGSAMVVLACEHEGKVNLMATATDEAQKMGAHAGNLIKAIAGLVGGGGGGRPGMAQAGGKKPLGIDEALKKAEEVAAGQIR